jgi:ElaA protein
MLKDAINLVREKNLDNVITIHAQTYAIPFYSKVGFKCVGDEFMEDGIPHYKMELYL